jgi:hypothetical protein
MFSVKSANLIEIIIYLTCVLVDHKHIRVSLAAVDSMCYEICAVGRWSNSPQISVLSLHLSMSVNIKECPTSRKQGCVFV